MARYDVIGLDPRGAGGPGTVRYLTDAQREEALDADLDPDLVQGVAGLRSGRSPDREAAGSHVLVPPRKRWGARC